MRPEAAVNRPETAPQRPALFGFAVAIAVAVILSLLWWSLRPGVPTIAMQRGVTDVVVSWRCPNGHTFEAHGSYEKTPCPECGRRADVLVTYHCANDGDHPARVRFGATRDGREAVSEISFGQSAIWREVKGEIACPNCGLKLSPKPANPFLATSEPAQEGD